MANNFIGLREFPQPETEWGGYFPFS
jgi:hypothetical protein